MAPVYSSLEWSDSGTRTSMTFRICSGVSRAMRCTSSRGTPEAPRGNHPVKGTLHYRPDSPGVLGHCENRPILGKLSAPGRHSASESHRCLSVWRGWSCTAARPGARPWLSAAHGCGGVSPRTRPWPCTATGAEALSLRGVGATRANGGLHPLPRRAGAPRPLAVDDTGALGRVSCLSQRNRPPFIARNRASSWSMRSSRSSTRAAPARLTPRSRRR